MAAYRLQHRIKAFWQVARLWLLGGVGLAALGGLFYFLATVGPKRVGQPVDVSSALDDPAMVRLSDEIGELERQYRQAADAKLSTEDASAALAKAVAKQRELLRTFTKAGLDQSSRLTRLESELDGVRAREKVTQVDRLQSDGEALLDAGKVDAAGEILREALRLQQEVNRSSAKSLHKNYVRETALTQAVAAVDAAPLRNQKGDALASARQAVSEQRWADALMAYTAARDAQARINREYGRTRYADLAEADRLSAEIESLNAAGIATEIEVKAKAGDAAMARGQAADAATCFTEAGALQLQVNQNYPRSRFVSSQLIENLEVKRQTALSFDLAEAIAGLDREITAHLGKRQVVAADQQLTLIAPKLEKIGIDYPKSNRLDGALRTKYAYLALRRENLRVIQDAVYDNLLPLPGVGGHQMLATEVPQSLFVLVMNTNPSRNPGRALPVDSVSWTDAQEFCTRLSWILGRTVRLPTIEEFRLALGEVGREGWSSENSGGRSHDAVRKQAGADGFVDLLGNLAEWACAEAVTDQAQVFGGSYLDAPVVLAKAPVELRLKRDRARHVGLRLVVE
jgi:hypothetical protein